MRIAKYIASCGLGSRRNCEEYITAGRIKLNGVVINDLGRQIDPACDNVTLDGKPCEPNQKVYYLVNKPAGYTSSVKERFADKLVTDLVPKKPPVWPVGRLDKNTRGLLILTNDGDLTQKLIHPKYKLEKEYLVATSINLSKKAINELREGVTLDDGPVEPDLFEEITPNLYRIVIHEGRKRIVRRIFKHFGAKEIGLRRVREGGITLDGLDEGKFRELTKSEIAELYNA